MEYFLSQFMLDVIIFMQSKKITLNIRQQNTKTSFTEGKVTRTSMPKAKKASRQTSNKFETTKPSNFSSSKNIKMRKTSMISRDGQETKYTSSNEQGCGSVRRDVRNTERLPQIYHPKPHSNKYFSTGKFDEKAQKMMAENILIQKSMTDEGFSVNQYSVKSNHKTEFGARQRSTRKNDFEKPIELTKEQKLQMYRMIRSDFHQIVNASNSVAIRNPKNHFRAYIQKGNNGILVKQILKKRWWWHLVDDPSKANFTWTQWYNRDFANSLPLPSDIEQTILVDDYTRRQSVSERKDKSEAIKMLIDSGTFEKLQNAIRVISNSNITFKQSKSIHKSPLVKNTSTLRVFTASENQLIHNHIDGCLQLHSKKLLFSNFHKYMINKESNPFQFIPLTYFIDNIDSPTVKELLDKYDDILKNNPDERNVWIIKPGENSNRGNGIKVVSSREQIQEQLNRRLTYENQNGYKRTVIVQKYLQKCFLINNRKFDIRCYLLITTVNGILKGYWYKDGYIRTSSAEYSLDNMDDEMIHLTNDAIQKKGAAYGKHQDSNKMSYEGFRQYIKKIGERPEKFDQALEQMKLIAYHLMGSVSNKIKKKQFTFELFGLDYMLDSQMRPLLIEANSNPCLDNKGKILSSLIHDLVDNVLMTAVDPVFPPPQSAIRRGSQYLNKDYFEANKFQLIFVGKARKDTKNVGGLSLHNVDDQFLMKQISDELPSPVLTISSQK